MLLETQVLDEMSASRDLFGPAPELIDNRGLHGLPDLARPALVAEVAAAVSRELLALGINWNLAPVADVLSTPTCPVGERSFGDDPRRVSSMVEAYVRGAAGSGIISCAKHFPGHGATDADSHHASPRIERSRAEIEAVDLPPFRSAIAAGVPTIMTTHITFPTLDPDLPATFSPAILGGLLRDDLGYSGLVVSDDLEMAGASERFTLTEGAARSLGAGADLFLVSGMLLPERDVPGLLDGLERLLVKGALEAADVDDSRRRVLGLKESSLTSFRASTGTEVLRCPEHLALLDRVHRRLEWEAADAEG